MAPRNADQSVAASVVGDSLGLNLNDLEGTGDGENDAGDDDGPDDTDQTGPDDGSDEGGADDEGRVSHTEDDDGGLDDMRLADDEQPIRQQRQDPRQVAYAKAHRFDAKGNVLDPKTGKVIAPAGPAARFHQEAYKAKGEAQRSQAQFQDAADRLEKAIRIGEALNEELIQARQSGNNPVAKQLGLNDQETVDALQLAAEAKREPLKAIQKLLIRAAANGIDVSKLGLPGGGAIDIKAITDLVREEIGKATKPINEMTERQRQQAESEQQSAERLNRSKEAVNSYFRDNQDMLPHAPIFLEVLRNPRFQNMSLTEIGLRIQLAQRNQGNGGRRTNGQNPRRQRSLPGGRGGFQPNNGGDELAHPSMSYDDILKPLVKQFYSA